jgi:uncharacterized membrane protein YcaP (DUF421 family)
VNTLSAHMNLVFRSFLTYFVLLTFTRIMGRKQISQLTFFDYIVGITIGSIAGVVALDKNIQIIDGLLSIGIWSLLTIVISEITLRNITLRLLIDSEPLLIIDKGTVIYKNMKKARYNMGDLLMQLRNKDVFNITDVEIAILEPDGKLSILKKSEFNIVTAGDMNIQNPRAGMMVDLILDGNILFSHLSEIQKDENWLMSQLKAKKIKNIKDVIFAGIPADGQIYIVTKY